MPVFIQYTCPTCGILRGGPQATDWHAPYTHAAFFTIVPYAGRRYAVIYALTATPDNPFPDALFYDMRRTLRAEGLRPIWEALLPSGELRLIGAPPGFILPPPILAGERPHADAT